MTTEYKIIKTDWGTDEPALRRIREAVFIKEQHVPVELEWDEFDPNAVHWLAFDKNSVIATARLLGNGHVGRMAVLPQYRGKGIGSALLDAITCYAVETGMGELFLNAQTRALGFYEKRGFRAEGEIFDDAGIPHRKMRKSLS